jgi:protein tyrosine/serine phosphatase
MNRCGVSVFDDRTGMLVMLLQSLLAVPDEVILDDYLRSNGNFHTPSNDRGSSAAAATVAAAKSIRGRLDRSIFSGTNRRAMVDTLAFLRDRYGSVSPGYLDAIGFDETWRRRLKAIFAVPTTNPPMTSTTQSTAEATSLEVPRSRL